MTGYIRCRKTHCFEFALGIVKGRSGNVRVRLPPPHEEAYLELRDWQFAHRAPQRGTALVVVYPSGDSALWEPTQEQILSGEWEIAWEQ